MRSTEIGTYTFKSLLMNKNIGANTVAFNVTVYWPPMGGDTDSAISSGVVTSHDNCIPVATTFSRMLVFVAGNDANGNLVIRLNIDGTNGNQVITLPAASGAATVQDTSNTDVVPVLGKISYEFNSTASASGNPDRLGMSMMAAF